MEGVTHMNAGQSHRVGTPVAVPGLSDTSGFRGPRRRVHKDDISSAVIGDILALLYSPNRICHGVPGEKKKGAASAWMGALCPQSYRGGLASPRFFVLVIPRHV